MRNKLIDSIYRLSEECGYEITTNIKDLSNTELINLFQEVVIENYEYGMYLFESGN